jgi:dCMP deaminase
MRQNKIENYMEHAIVAAKRSHDKQTQVGAILVKNDSGAIIATGFNGFVRGAPDSVLPNTRPDKYEFMMHAEENIISHCTRHGISALNTTLYCTLSPCARCTRLLWQSGITKVVAKTKYSDWESVLNMRDLHVDAWEDQYNFTQIEYSEWKDPYP